MDHVFFEIGTYLALAKAFAPRPLHYWILILRP